MQEHITLTLETGEQMTVPVADIVQMSTDAIETAPTRDGWKQFSEGQTIAKLKDGRTLNLRQRHPPNFLPR